MPSLINNELPYVMQGTHGPRQVTACARVLGFSLCNGACLPASSRQIALEVRCECRDARVLLGN
jgi:hypothetical protein